MCVCVCVCVCRVCRPARGGVGYSEEAQQRFSSAKSISSDQYFGRSSGNDSVSFLALCVYTYVSMCVCVCVVCTHCI